MPMLLRPQNHHQYRIGDAVYYLGGSHRLLLGGSDITHMVNKSVRPVPAIVVSPGQCFSQIRVRGGRHLWVSPYDLAFRGFCPACGVPAVLDANQQLICPSCNTEAADVPPPDPMVMCWHPGGSGWLTPMIIHRAVLNPRVTYRQARHDSRMALRRAYREMLAQLHLLQSQQLDNQAVERLTFHAMLREDDAFRELYHQLTRQSVRMAA